MYSFKVITPQCLKSSKKEKKSVNWNDNWTLFFLRHKLISFRRLIVRLRELLFLKHTSLLEVVLRRCCRRVALEKMSVFRLILKHKESIKGESSVVVLKS
ncbi:hypothetical protein CEXT_558621 [Caerostris extrusa]|uniref:Uncharacterized protein n=1 Tax=Caerostris extrusa TaxID=172846 RepID=A0AAV4YC50_CAEEX|nr:hypothetical protein CEXT_558621 [Caerostris extrusa]